MCHQHILSMRLNISIFKNKKTTFIRPRSTNIILDAIHRKEKNDPLSRKRKI